MKFSEESDSLSTSLHDLSSGLSSPGSSFPFGGDDQRPSLQLRGYNQRPSLRSDVARLMARVHQLLLNPRFMRLLSGFVESQRGGEPVARDASSAENQQRGVRVARSANGAESQ